MTVTPHRASWLLLALVLAACGGEDAPYIAPEVRIAQLESSVLPSFRVRGEPVVPQSLASRMAHHGVPGVSIAVIKDGQIEWARGFGYADRDAQRPVQVDTLFQAASISKAVAAVGALRLVQGGMLQLDQDVNLRLKSWRLPESEFSRDEKVTLRRLLNHTAGTTVWGFPGYEQPSLPSTAAILRGDGNTDPITVWKTPGAGWRYSGGGYTIMQQLMEDVTGRPFGSLLNELALKPLGMTASTFEQPLPESLSARAALGYDGDGAVVGNGWHHYPELAAAGLWTTPTDLAHYAIKVQRAHRGAPGERILNRALAQIMLAPGANDWGLGPSLSSDHKRFGHGGSNAGFRAQVTAFIKGGAGVAVMTNSDNGDALIAELLVTLAHLYEWPGMQADEKAVVALSDEEYQAIAGVYDVGPLGEVEIAIENGRALASIRTRTVELRPESASDFFIADTGMDVRFERTDGAVTALLIEGLRGPRIDPASARASET